MTADEARELVNGSMKYKGLFFKLKLSWMCGRINQEIEKRAEKGGMEIEVTKNSADAKQYYPIIAQLYEKQGYFVAYNSRYDSFNKMLISWEDFTKLDLYTLQVYLESDRYQYHTKSFDQYLKRNRIKKGVVN